MYRKRRNSTTQLSVQDLKLPPIGTLQDLIDYCSSFSPPVKRQRRTKKPASVNYPFQALVVPLQKLQSMIGLEDVKPLILSQLLYFLQGLHNGELDMLHTVIQGPPGVGKTKLARILGEIYASAGILRSSVFVVARRSDLVGKFLGHTAEKTQAVIDSCRGGVLLIDEAYSLGHTGDNKDSFSKECLDTLNQNLTENRDNFMCIVAGYEQSLNECFFASNEGLARRFTFKYTLKPYSSKELYEIFKQMVEENGWELEQNTATPEFFEKNKKLFPYSAGDLETLFLYAKLAHAQNITLYSNKTKYRCLTSDDTTRALENMKVSRESSKGDKGPPCHMYL